MGKNKNLLWNLDGTWAELILSFVQDMVWVKELTYKRVVSSEQILFLGFLIFVAKT